VVPIDAVLGAVLEPNLNSELLSVNYDKYVIGC
jgi:hypothetical protein